MLCLYKYILLISEEHFFGDINSLRNLSLKVRSSAKVRLTTYLYKILTLFDLELVSHMPKLSECQKLDIHIKTTTYSECIYFSYIDGQSMSHQVQDSS